MTRSAQVDARAGIRTRYGVDRSPTITKDRKLTHTELLNIRATAITLIPAPGAGKVVIVDEVIMFFDVTTTGYTESTDNLEIEYTTGPAAIMVVETTGFIDQTSDQLRRQTPAVGVSTPVANSAVRIRNTGDGEFGAGNAANVLRLRIRYRIENTGEIE